MNKIITMACLAIFAILPTLLSAQGQLKPKTFKLEMPVSVKNDTAAFRQFIEGPEGKKIKSISKVTRIEQGPTCPDCDNPYGRFVYEFELFDESEPPAKLITETICDGKTTVFNGEILSKGAIRYDTISSKTGGKDTLVTYVLHLLSTPTQKLQQDVCFGDTVVVNGQKVWETSVLYYTVPGTECDVDVSHFVKVLPQPEKVMQDTIFTGDTITIRGQKVWQTDIIIYKIAGAECDTIVKHKIVVLPKPKDNRVHVYVEETLGFEPGRSPINKDVTTSTHIGLTVSPDNRWLFYIGLGHFPNWDFNIPTELDSLPEQPSPDAGWNPCNCDEKNQVFSLQLKAAYSVPVKKLSVFGGTGGFRLSVGYDYAFSVPVDGVTRKEWALPGALDLQAAVYWQRTVKGGGTVVAELGPVLEALYGNAGGQFRLRFIMPTKNKT